MKHFFLLLIYILIFPCLLLAQSQQVTVKISGLTCSQCTRSVEKQLQKLKFISTIDMDLQQTKAVLHIKKDQPADYYAIAKAVTNAGFSVASVTVNIPSNQLNIIDDHCGMLHSKYFYFIEPITNKQDKVVKVELIGTPFHPSKKYNNNKSQICGGKNAFIVHLLP